MDQPIETIVCDGPKMMLSNGKVLDLLNPDPAVFDLALIANGLSREGRYSNQTQIHYSVAEHTLHCCHVYKCLGGQKFAKHVFLHDASEAVLKDIPRPIKMLIPEYRKLEAKIQTVILERFGVVTDEEASVVVATVDNVVLKAERKRLFQGHTASDSLAGYTDFPLVIPCYSAPAAEKLFLSLAEELGIQ